MCDDAHAQGNLPPGPARDRPHGPTTGWELLRGRAAGGEVVTFVCYDDGYALRRDGHAVPGCRWDADRVDEALAAYRDLASR